MKTSYYQSRKLNPKKHLVVQTSVGNARWGTQPDCESECLKPPSAILGFAQMPYTRDYVAHLERIGVETIQTHLAELTKAAQSREVVLCCFEALKKPGQFCHRRIFARWWQQQTGETIEEL